MRRSWGSLHHLPHRAASYATEFLPLSPVSVYDIFFNYYSPQTSTLGASSGDMFGGSGGSDIFGGSGASDMFADASMSGMFGATSSDGMFGGGGGMFGAMSKMMASGGDITAALTQMMGGMSSQDGASTSNEGAGSSDDKDTEFTEPVHRHVMEVLLLLLRQMIMFAKALPGFLTLQCEDQAALVKGMCTKAGNESQENESRSKMISSGGRIRLLEIRK